MCDSIFQGKKIILILADKLFLLDTVLDFAFWALLLGRSASASTCLWIESRAQATGKTTSQDSASQTLWEETLRVKTWSVLLNFQFLIDEYTKYKPPFT